MFSTHFKPQRVFAKPGFWSRPEGTTGMVFLCLLAAAGVLLANRMLPELITFLDGVTSVVERSILLGALGAALFLLLTVLTDRRLHRLVGYGFKSAMRAITRLFVEVDPIGILRNYLDDLREKLARIDSDIAQLSGQMVSVRQFVDHNKARANACLRQLEQARAQNNQPHMQFQARELGRLEKSNESMQNLVKRMEVLHRVLMKMRDASDLMIRDISSEVQLKEQERRMVRSAHSAMGSAMSIIRGEPNQRELFDMSMEHLTEDYGQKLGEIEHFVAFSKSFIDSMDLQNGAYESEALKRLEEWEKRSEALFIQPEPQRLPPDDSAPHPAIR